MISTSNELYEAALKSKRSTLFRVLYAAWLVLGLSGLILIAWAEPFSGRLFRSLLSDGCPSWLITFVLSPLVMALRAVLAVESIGYVYHRFFQHLGWLTRRAQLFRRNQRFHWIHHMIYYPIGRFYRRARAYVASEKGVGLSWVVPALIASVLFLLTNGVNFGSFFFIGALGLYAKYVIDLTHSRFHEVNHPWANSPYFHWLEEIHLLHHWDQRTNFTIVHPLMDQLFGTYAAPKSHPNELKAALEDKDLTVSDLINWKYLLIEASPAEYAAFVSAAKTHPKSLRKVYLLMQVLKDRLSSHPQDALAQLLRTRSLELLKECGKTAPAGL